MSQNKHLDQFMSTFPNEGLTFDDVSLITQYSDFLPSEAKIKTRLSTNIHLNIPFVSAAMDTVTEANMAIAMALHGGIGIIHKNLDPEGQVEHVERVKHHLNGLIQNPITFNGSQTLSEIKERCNKKAYNFNGFPILDDQSALVGILTSKDIKFAKNQDVRAEDIMTRTVITAEEGTTLQQAYEIMKKNKIGKLPIVKNGQLVGLYSYTDVADLIENTRPLYNRDDQYRLRVGAAIGPENYKRAEALYNAGVDVIVVDTAHGHSKGVIEMTTWVKKNLPDIDVIAGNIATGEAALALQKAGADAVKVGIGPGSICTTRVVAGVGIPQLSAIYSCAASLKGSIPVIADGGIRHSGDIAKALTAGASTVMMGSVLAGTDESPGEKIFRDGRQFVVYRGMGSFDAMKSREGSRQRYGQKEGADDELVPQGIEGVVPYAGEVSKVLKQYCGGLEASLGYCGTKTIADLQQTGQLIRVSAAGTAEAHPHDIHITKEAPNYRR